MTTAAIAIQENYCFRADQLRKTFTLCVLLLIAIVSGMAQDVPNSKDPAGMKRYEGSRLIGYRAPRFDEYLLPLGPPTGNTPLTFEKSEPLEGQVSYYTYLAPAGRSPAEMLRNYKLEFQRLGVEIQFEKKAGDPGWFGAVGDKFASVDDVVQMISYNEPEERMIVGKTKDGKTHYLVFVTSYNDGTIPDRLEGKVAKGQALASLVVISADTMEKKMAFLNADDMKQALHDSGKVVLYGLYFDTDKDVVKAESQTTLAEIAKLFKSEPSLRVHVVGHTDNQGKADYNLDLSRRRATSIVRELTGKFGIAASRLDSFGCGVYAPIASNEAEEGRAKNRRVELVQWQ